MPVHDPRVQQFPVPGYHSVTRWLHACLVLGVIFQLLFASMMTHPDHDDGGHGAGSMHHEAVAAVIHHRLHEDDIFGESLMAAHRSGGLIVAMIVLANLLWAVVARGNPRKRQVAVLFSAQCWHKALSIAKGLPWILQGKGDLPEPGNALALVFEMLGLLVMTAMAVSGTIIWFLWAGPDHAVSPQAQAVMEIHASIAVLLFLYLTGHISMALMHARAGDPVFSRILPWVKRNMSI